MNEKGPLVDPSLYDLNHVVAGPEEVLRYLPQRHEMLHLSAVVYDNAESGLCVGYFDIPADAFWVRGHMPGAPLMPGVLMCEAAAQLCTYHTAKHDLLKVPLMGFGGLDEVRFRDIVFAGDRLVIIAKRLAVRPRSMIRSRFQCLVGSSIACEGEMRGVPISIDAIRAGRQA